MVLTSARWRVSPCGMGRAIRRDCPPLFLWLREGSREHAVGFEPAHAGRWAGAWIVRSLSTEEIGYGQQ